MEEINPFAEEPVCRYSEVVTAADFEVFEQQFEIQEKNATVQNDVEKALASCVAHKVCRSFIIWIKQGKPEDFSLFLGD